MSELDKAAALMFPGFKPGGCAPGQTRAAGAQGRGTPPPSAPAPAPTKAAKRAIVKTGGTLRGQLRVYSIAGGKVGRVTFKDRTDERDQGDAVRERMKLWNRRNGS